MELDAKTGRTIVVGDKHSGRALGIRKPGFAGAVTVIGGKPEHSYERPALSKPTLVDLHAQPVFLAEEARWAVLAIGDAATWPGRDGLTRNETWDHAQRSAGIAARAVRPAGGRGGSAVVLDRPVRPHAPARGHAGRR